MKDEEDLWALWSRIQAGIEEAAQIRRAQLTHPDLFVGKSPPRIRGQQDLYAIQDETRSWRPAPGTVEAVAAKYATEPNHQFAGIVHRAEHYGVDYLGNR